MFNKGYIAVLATILVLTAIIGIGISMTTIVVVQHKISTGITHSSQAYVAAESGIEDAVLRIRRGWNAPSAYTLSVNGVTVDVQIGDAIGSSRIITVNGEQSNVFRKLQAVHSMGGDEVQFFFGAQVGEGGITMASNARIEGNVFSNGHIIGPSSARITGFAEIAGSGSRVEGIRVDEDVRVYDCKDAVIVGTLYLAGGSEDNCTYGALDSTTPVPVQPLPITQEQIDEWKAEAENGGVYFGNYVLNNNEDAAIGPLKIDGDLLFSNNNTLTLQGTVWVTGKIQTGNNTTIKLDGAVYGSASGVLLADGIIQLSNNAIIQGSGQPGSELMLLSTSPNNPAIDVANNVDGGIFYASDGFVKISNNGRFREVTGYGLELANNVVIEYEVGLSSIFFKSGPGGGWEIESWQEIE